MPASTNQQVHNLAVREPKIGEVREVASAIRMAAPESDKAIGRTVLFIGAGCSKSAGIPLSTDIAKALVRRLARKMLAPNDVCAADEEAYRWLAAQTVMRDCCAGEQSKSEPDKRPIEWYRVYDALFDDHYTVPDEVRDIFSEFVENTKGAVNWAHLCLGELVRTRLVSSVITTNFDQLCLAGIVRAGELPVVCDGIESLSRISGLPRHPQLIELHGSRHTYRLRNAREEVAEVGKDRPAITAIGSIFQSLNTFVAVGYGGREDGVMDLLIDAANRFPDKRLIWVVHGNDPSRISPKVSEFLASSRNALLILDQDADSFFLRLLKAPGIGVPESVREPLTLINCYAAALATHDNEEIAERAVIAAEISRHRSEISALKECLTRFRNQRTTLQATIATARELRLAGKLEEALTILLPVAKQEEDAHIWREIGEMAYEIGETSPDSKNLEIAIDAWQRVLAMVSRNSAPLDWATAQNNLGAALSALGERESDTARLEQAVDAFRAALQERTRERVPLQWAATQNNLGGALSALGDRESDTARLEQAVDAYHAALQERTRERVPLQWARTHNNLGAALQCLGEHESDAARLEQAVDAYRDALQERTRERVPLQWAATQNNLGNALSSLGRRESDAARLEQAVDAYRAALQEYTRERVPLDWAMTQNNLGITLRALGERESDTARLEQAVEAYHAALDVYEQAKAKHFIDRTRSNLARAEALLAERRSHHD